MSKDEIRKIIIKKRKNIKINYLNNTSFLIIKRIIDAFNLINKNIGIYFPINNEINVTYFFNLQKINLFFPKIQKNKMVFSEINHNDKKIIQKSTGNNPNFLIKKNNYKEFSSLIFKNKTIQPKYKKNVLMPEIIIVPLIGFNEKCFRIGYGKGYYDRYLKNKKIIKIGVAFHLQKSEFHVEPHDIPLDYIFTEKRIYRKECKKLF